MSLKDSAQVTRLIVYLIVFAIVLAIAWWGTPQRVFKPRGVLLPASITGYAATDLQAIAVSQGSQSVGTLIGSINIEAYAPEVTHEQELAAVQYAKQLATQAGANQLTITQFLRDPQSKTLILYAQASRV